MLVSFIISANIASGKVLPRSEYEKDAEADCIYAGEFKRVDQIKINGRDTRPFATKVATFRIDSSPKKKDELCERPNGEVDVVFSVGHSTEVEDRSETCLFPEKPEGKYRIRLKLVNGEFFVPALCHGWIELPTRQ